MISCFEWNYKKNILVWIQLQKWNEIVNKSLWAGDKFMPEIHSKQAVFTYSICGPFTKNKERIQKLEGTGDAIYIYKNELDKACF